MKSRLRRQFKNPLGFTLIELVLVIALIVILSATIMPSINRNYTSTTDDMIINDYFPSVQKQVGKISSLYNEAVPKGETPVLAGYLLTTARGIQECLRAANNHSNVYDIEVRTVNVAPDPNEYNYIDTIVICITFYTADFQPIVNSKGKTCSPEQAAGGAVANSCMVMGVWYIKKDYKSSAFLIGGAL